MSFASLLPLSLPLVMAGPALALEPPASFRVAPDAAGRAPLVPLDARSLAEARADLGRGRPADALKRLEGLRESRLKDRAALVAGDALLALAQADGALDAYARAARLAQTSKVRMTAARGVIECLELLDRPRERLAWIEALREIERGRLDLRLAHAETLLALDRPGRADPLLKSILIDAPRSPLASTAALLRRQVPPKVRSDFTRSELRRRFEAELAAGAAVAARRTLALLTGLSAREKKLLEWQWTRAAGHRSQEVELLDALLEAAPSGERAEALWLRRGRIALNADDTDGAVERFDQAVERFPGTREAVEAGFLAGWSLYDEGRYAEAEARMRAFTKRFARTDQVTEAWWYAGWSAYLDGRDDAARDAWSSLIKDHPRSDLVPFAHYWTGRSFERNENREAAVAAYQRASGAAPLSHYAFWARERLEALGEEVERPTPPESAPAFDLRQILVELGPGRPISVDRAVALHSAGLEDDVDDEVRTLLGALPAPTTTRQAVSRLDLVHGLGAHARAFRYAYAHRPPARRVMEGDYWAWRAYRHLYPKAHAASVEPAADGHGVDPLLVWSIMRSESHYRDDALSPVGARGLMQLMPATARRIGRMVAAARPHSARFVEPESNVWLGAWYLGRLAERYRGYLPAQIGAYNAGPTAMDRWLDELEGRPTDELIERISYRETRRYVRRVLETLWTYELLYGRERTRLPPTAEREPAPDDAVAF